MPPFSLRRFASAGTLLLACLLAPVTYADTFLSVEHASGTTDVSLLPEKVVVIDWSTLDTLQQLGVTVQGTPSNAAPDLLAQYRSGDFIRAGSLFEPDLEVLKNSQPDLIILGRRAQPQFAEVARFGPTIDLTPNPRDLLGSLKRNTRILGQIYAREEQAEVLIARLESSIQQLREMTAVGGNGLLVLTTGGRMAAFGSGTRFGMIHDVFGLPQAVDNLQVGRHGHSVSFEFLLEANPDWLFVMDRDAAIGREGVAAAQLMDNELVKATTAGQKGQIVYLDPVSWYLLDNSGIGVMQTSVDALIEAFAAANR